MMDEIYEGDLGKKGHFKKKNIDACLITCKNDYGFLLNEK
jgi:hypothetical protein